MKKNKLLRPVKGPLVTYAYSTGATGIYPGDVTLSCAIDVEELKKFHTIAGSVTVTGNFSLLCVPGVTRIVQDLIITGPKMHDASFPDLRSVGGSIKINNCGIKTLDLPELTTVGLNVLEDFDLSFLPFFLAGNDPEDWNLTISNCPKLKQVRLPMLAYVGRHIKILENQNLRLVELPALELLGGEIVTKGCVKLDEEFLAKKNLQGQQDA